VRVVTAWSAGGSAGSRAIAHNVGVIAIASNRNSIRAPTTGISTPASNGPAMPANQTDIDCKAFAAGSSPEGTRRGTTAPPTAAFAPNMACCTAMSGSSTATDFRPAAACAHNSADVTAMPALVTSSIRRRSTTSAIAPPHSAATTIGAKPARLARPT